MHASRLIRDYPVFLKCQTDSIDSKVVYQSNDNIVRGVVEKLQHVAQFRSRRTFRPASTMRGYVALPFDLTERELRYTRRLPPADPPWP